MTYKKPIILINPPLVSLPGNPTFWCVLPLGLAYLASYLIKSGFNVKVIDALGLGMDKKSDWKDGSKIHGLTIKEIVASIPSESDFIGITTNFTSQHSIYSILISTLKNVFPEKKIIIGGNEATANYKRYLRFGADYVVLGEAEVTLLKLLHTLLKKNGSKNLDKIDGLAYKDKRKIVCNPKKNFIKNLDMLPFPARHLFPLENYWKAKRSQGPVNKRFTEIISSRGCPFNCFFCSSSVFWQRNWRARRPENFVEEIEECVEKYGITEFQIEDDNLTLDKQRAKKIFELIIKKDLKISWSTPNGIRPENLNREMLKLMKRSGCVLLAFAPESGSQRILKEVYNKRIDLNKITSLVKDCNDLGIKTSAFFVVGLPIETEEDKRQTRAYIKKLAKAGLDEIGAFACLPYPNTEIRRRYFDENMPGIDDVTSGVPSWYPNADAVYSYVKELYIRSILYKTIYHPAKMIRSMINILLNRQTLKTEREIIRRKKEFFNRFLGAWRK